MVAHSTLSARIERYSMGGKPSKQTPADKRLTRNKPSKSKK